MSARDTRRVVAPGEHVRGGGIVVAVSIGALATTLLLLISLHGWVSAFHVWNVPAMTPHFADLRSWTGGAESVRAGLDPMLQNPGDPWGRPLNYPRVWQLAYGVGVDPSWTTTIGCLFVAAFLAAVLAIGCRLDVRRGLVLSLGTASPVAVFAIERGNTDLLMFALTAAAVVLMRRRPWLSGAAVMAGCVLKLFPIAAAIAFHEVRPPVRRRLVIAVGLLAAAYVSLTFDDVQLMLATTQSALAWSYGASSIWRWRLGVGATPSPAVLGALSSSVVLAAALLFGRRIGRAAPTMPRAVSVGDRTAFLAGAGVFVVTFVAGTSWGYRAIFLLLTLPLLAAGCGGAARRVQWAVRAALVSALLVLWLPLVEPAAGDWDTARTLTFLAGEAASWVAFASIAVVTPLVALPTPETRAEPRAV